MIEIYCRGHSHAGLPVCERCEQVLRYAMECIEACPFGEETKPVCGLCPTQCFDAARLAQFRRVMGYAGPRMLVSHPVLAVLHFFDALGKAHRK